MLYKFKPSFSKSRMTNIAYLYCCDVVPYQELMIHDIYRELRKGDKVI